MAGSVSELQAEIDRLEEVSAHTYEQIWELKQELAEVYELENAPKYVKCGTWRWGDRPEIAIGKYVRAYGNNPSRPFTLIEKIEYSSPRHFNFQNRQGHHIFWSMHDQPAVDLYMLAVEDV